MPFCITIFSSGCSFSFLSVLKNGMNRYNQEFSKLSEKTSKTIQRFMFEKKIRFFCNVYFRITIFSSDCSISLLSVLKNGMNSYNQELSKLSEKILKTIQSFMFEKNYDSSVMFIFVLPSFPLIVLFRFCLSSKTG